MDYGRRPLADRLAAEYVLGTLRGPARRRFERLLPAHPTLREAVAGWETRLHPLAESVTPQAVPPRVWQGIEARLFPAATGASGTTRAPWWRNLTLWRLSTGAALSALLVLAVLTQVPAPPQAPLVVVLGANPAAQQAVAARFVASVSPDGRALVLRPIDPPTLQATQALELWAVPAAGPPRSLGLVRADGQTQVLRAGLLHDTAAFAVSVEPPGGSRTGLPTGPIVSLGKVQS